MMPEVHTDDVYTGLQAILPKLAQPSWVHLIGAQTVKPVTVPIDKKAAKKDAKMRYKTYKRFLMLCEALGR